MKILRIISGCEYVFERQAPGPQVAYWTLLTDRGSVAMCLEPELDHGAPNIRVSLGFGPELTGGLPLRGIVVMSVYLVPDIQTMYKWYGLDVEVESEGYWQDEVIEELRKILPGIVDAVMQSVPWQQSLFIGAALGVDYYKARIISLTEERACLAAKEGEEEFGPLSSFVYTEQRQRLTVMMERHHKFIVETEKILEHRLPREVLKGLLLHSEKVVRLRALAILGREASA